MEYTGVHIFKASSLNTGERIISIPTEDITKSKKKFNFDNQHKKKYSS